MSKLYKTPLSEVQLNRNGLPLAFQWRERWYIVKSCVVKTLLGQGTAPRLVNCARIIVNKFNGRVPDTEEELLQLPGVGQYISNAVLSYAFDKPTVPIDTNVIRLFSRYFCLTSDKSRPRSDSKLAANIRMLFRNFDSTRIPNLAVLDFASVICTARNPRCPECPINNRTRAPSIYHPYISTATRLPATAPGKECK